VLVVDLTSGKELYRSDPKLEPLSGFAWLGARRLGTLVRSPEAEAAKPPAPGAGEDGEDAPGPTQRLQAVDFDASPTKVTVLGSVSGEAQLSLPSSSADGSRVVFSRHANDGMHLALYDRKTERLEPLAVSDGYDPAISPAGDKIAFMTDNDIAIYDIAKQTKTSLTSTGGDFSLRYPQFSLDGRVVYFELRAKDPVFPQERSLSAIASVPVP
jgi:Tol biopolymer transport system component